MSGSQKVLKVFGILELVLAVVAAIAAISSGDASSWLGVASSLLAAYLLLAAAKDASKAGAAWFILLVALVLSAGELYFAVTGGGDAAQVIGSGIAIVLNLIALIAAGNVKKQAKR